MENGLVKQVDSYFGDVRDKDNHDRLTVDTNTGDLTGKHKKW